jgi:CubicO group peptidase (beta-lactamase class C family)
MGDVAEDFMRNFDAPGLSLSIRCDGLIVYEQAFGVTGHDSRERLTNSNLFRFVSVSKPIIQLSLISPCFA